MIFTMTIPNGETIVLEPYVVEGQPKRSIPSRIRSMSVRRRKSAIREWLKALIVSEVNKCVNADGKIAYEDFLNTTNDVLKSVIPEPKFKFTIERLAPPAVKGGKK